MHRVVVVAVAVVEATLVAAVEGITKPQSSCEMNGPSTLFVVDGPFLFALHWPRKIACGRGRNHYT
jgi:hypothetical protein